MKYLILVALLGSNFFQVREAAQQALRSDYGSAVYVVGGSLSSDPEVANRCDRIVDTWLHKYRLKLLEAFCAFCATQIDGVSLPYIDSIQDPDSWRIICKYRQESWNFPAFAQGRYPQDSAATAAFIHDWMFEGRDIEELKTTLAKMRTRSAYYDKHCKFAKGE